MVIRKTPKQPNQSNPHTLGVCMNCVEALRADAHHVHVGVHRLQRHLLWGGEERAHVDVEAQVRKGGGDHVGISLAPPGG